MAGIEGMDVVSRPKPNEFYYKIREEYVNAQKILTNKVKEYSKEIYELRRKNNQLEKKIKSLENTDYVSELYKLKKENRMLKRRLENERSSLC